MVVTSSTLHTMFVYEHGIILPFQLQIKRRQKRNLLKGKLRRCHQWANRFHQTCDQQTILEPYLTS
jgi:hypothetical protein